MQNCNEKGNDKLILLYINANIKNTKEDNIFGIARPIRKMALESRYVDENEWKA